MSSGSTVYLVKYVRTLSKKTAKKCIAEYKEHNKDMYPHSEVCVPDVITYSPKNEKNKFYELNTSTYELYTVLADHSFTSDFSQLVDYYYLRYEMCRILSPIEAFKIKQACDYLLYGKYDRALENILDNEFITVFGEDYSRYYLLNKKYYSDDVAYEHHLKALSAFLGAYFKADSSNLALIINRW